VARRARGQKGDSRYLLRFAVTAFLLIAGTLVLVLYVLPERYVLSSGFRESGMSFPQPTTPFVPVPAVRMAARDLPAVPQVIPPGPAEVFWSAVGTLLEEQRYEDALPDFQRYLGDFPSDRDVRREYVVTLLAAGRSDDAVDELRRLLTGEDDFLQRLLLARTLRELGRTDESAREYAALVEARPDDIDLWLEYARAYAWVERYDEAAAVLEGALATNPDSVPLRIELARVEFARNGLERAAELLAGIPDGELAAQDGSTLRNDIRAALAEPEVVEEPVPPPTLLELAVRAREDDDFDRSRELFGEALRESPDDPEIWLAYANLLEYELNDLEGARTALLEVERLTAQDTALQLRLAQLEIWTERNEEARARLTALLPLVESDALATAEVHARLGDLDRWEGDRVAAARHYRLALDTDPANLRAHDGFNALFDEVARLEVELEEPGAGGTSYALQDTDDFTRLDLAGEWVQVDDDWVWSGNAGNRWLDGRGLDGLPADVRQGLFVDLEAARWWRWATLRSGARFGAERVRDQWDFTVGASLQHRAVGGGQTEVAVEHGPAYPATATLQSAMVGVVQDHVAVSHARPVGERWTLSGIADAAWLRTDLDTIPTASNGSTARLSASLSLGRAMSETLTLGLSARAMGYTSSGPVVTDSASIQRRLFWDPRMAVSVGPFARLSRDLSDRWRVTGNLGPGVAFLDERGSSGWGVVPHVSAEAGVRRQGERFWTGLDLFFYQGQFDGYRMYGARLSLRARDWSRLGGTP
jgi:tetratricopeptide (TPR) repeat protein